MLTMGLFLIQEESKMANITVYSKVLNDIKFSNYVHQMKEDPLLHKPVVVSSRGVKSFVINGVNSVARENRLMIHPNTLGETIVDKELWEAFLISPEGIANPLIKSGQIFTAKNTVEAKLMAKDVGGNMFDPLTDALMKEKALQQQNRRKVM